MRQIRYGSSAHVLRLEYPIEWDPTAISGLTVAISDIAGNALLAAAAATLYTATSIDGAVAQYAETVTLDSGAGALSPGDRILISGVGGDERRTVKDYDSTNKIVTLDQQLKYDHADDSVVSGIWGIYSLDASDTDAWTAGLGLRILWTPAGTGSPITEEGEVVKTALEIAGIEQLIKDNYERAYNALVEPTDRLARVIAEAQRQIRAELSSDGFSIDRIVDQDAIASTVAAKVAYIWTLNGDINMEDERNALLKEYEARKGYLQRLAAWTDNDQDGIQDEYEVTDHEWYPVGSW